MKIYQFLVVVLILLLPTQHVFSQKNQQELPEKTRILFLLDASGSMLGKWEKTTRIVAAKRLLSDLVDSLQVNTNLELGLRVYGHQFHRRFQNCKDTKLEVSFRQKNHESIKQKLRGLQPQGTTPLAYSLEQAANDFPDKNNIRNIIIIITDGIESCDGDPCAVSLALQKKNVFLKPFIIGIGMNKSFEKNFSCLGKFFDASNIRQFRKVLNKVIQQTLNKTTVSVELLDERNKPTVSNINVSFINNMTHEPVYDFVHFRDDKGRPDSVEIDAVLGYDLIVNTLPPIIKRNINIAPGRHNVLKIQAPQGNLQFIQSGYSEYNGGINIIVRKNKKQQTINSQYIKITQKYLAGIYDVEIPTLPRIYIKGIKITAGSTKKITIPGPGVLNIYASNDGYGSVYKIKKDGQQQWIKTLKNNQLRHSFAMQPGRYKLVFRADKAMGSKYTSIKKFEIKTGATTNIKVF